MRQPVTLANRKGRVNAALERLWPYSLPGETSYAMGYSASHFAVGKIGERARAEEWSLAELSTTGQLLF